MNLINSIFILTSDQDWAPSWAAESFLNTTKELPVHVFRTNPCPILDEAHANGRITQGWHPNLLPGSSHGTTQEDIIEYMIKHFPGCNTARNHTYLTNTHFDRLLFKSGIRADSQIATNYPENLSPLLDISGIIRFPVFFEDDVFFSNEAPSLDLRPVVRNLFSPGLKVFNLHPTFIACNTPNSENYSKYRDNIFQSSTPQKNFIFNGRGSKNIFLEIKQMIFDNGFSFSCFQNVVDKYFDK